MIMVVVGLAALCVLVTLLMASSNKDNSAPPPATPSPSSTGHDDTRAVNEEISDTDQPSADEIWDFETAYSTADPADQLALLEKVALPQYIDAEYTAVTIDVNNLVVRVDRKTSSFSIQKDIENAYCYVTSKVNLNSFRDDQHVLAYSIQHTTMWVNTKDGWKVASEVR
jgi:hypothetical protein